MTTTTSIIANTIVKQISRGDLLAISGGRFIAHDRMVVLPVASGYSVEIEYNEGVDLYTVRRIYTRGLKRWVKGEVSMVDCFALSEVAYKASCYHDKF